MKKVCHVTTVHSPFDTRIFHKEAKTLANAGYEVLLIAQHDKEEIVDGTKIIPLPRPKNRLTRTLFLTKKAYKLALEQKADIYHFHDPELLPWMAKLKNKTGVKMIYDVHENVPKSVLSKHWIPRFLRRIIAFTVDIWEKRYSRKLDKIITVTESIAERFQKEKTIIIRNTPLLIKIDKIIPIEYKKEKPIVVYEGGMTEIRGVREIIKAATILKNEIKLWLMGPFLPPVLEEKILTEDKKEYVDYKGNLPLEEMYSFLKCADIGLLLFLPEPNHLESLPNKLFEYMAVGIPVIASNFPLWKEIIEGNNCGICVNPLNPKEIAKAVEYLIEYPEEAKRMGENGRKAVLEKYNWENEGRKLLKLYKNLLIDNY